MPRVFITGSADGLGRMAARLLVEQGHHVVLHARSQARADAAMASVPGAQTAVVGDLSSIRETRGLAEQVNRLGCFDAVIHNAGVGYRDRPPHRNGRRLAARLCHQHPGTLHPYRTDREAEAPGLPRFWHAPQRRPQPAGHHLD